MPPRVERGPDALLQPVGLRPWGSPHDVDTHKDLSSNSQHAQHFFEAIGRPDLHTRLTPDHPFGYWSMEFMDVGKVGIKGGGGLGVLAGDTRRLAEQLEIPLVVVTPFYSKRIHQGIERFVYETEQEFEDNGEKVVKKVPKQGFKQVERVVVVSPAEEGFIERDDIEGVSISTASHLNVPLQIWDKVLGTTGVVAVYEPELGELYAGKNSDNHRLYQDVVLGFGGHQALKKLGLTPPMMQLNEAPTVFAAIAELDDLTGTGEGKMGFDEALETVQNKTFYTNHSLVQAVESKFSAGQFEHFVLPNIKNDEVINWVMSQFGDGVVKLSSLAIELSAPGNRNCVSDLHAREADYRDSKGERVVFEAVTNGISLEEWVERHLLEHYRTNGVLTKHDLPTDDYRERIAGLDPIQLRELKARGRGFLDRVLAERVDQYGEPVNIPDGAIVYDFKRRFADYKRPTMIFHDTNRLASILTQQDAHIIITGKAHPDDDPMKDELARMLQIIHDNPELKKRVHYVQDYDETVGQALGMGGDIAINVPIVGREACGTSWEKDIINGKILISTNDGGVADIEPPAFLEVTGETYWEEVDSLYQMMDKAGEIVKNNSLWDTAVKHQLASYLPIISGPRMMRDYFNLVLPPESQKRERSTGSAQQVLFES